MVDSYYINFVKFSLTYLCVFFADNSAAQTWLLLLLFRDVVYSVVFYQRKRFTLLFLMHNTHQDNGVGAGVMFELLRN